MIEELSYEDNKPTLRDITSRKRYTEFISESSENRKIMDNQSYGIGKENKNNRLKTAREEYNYPG